MIPAQPQDQVLETSPRSATKEDKSQNPETKISSSVKRINPIKKYEMFPSIFSAKYLYRPAA